VTTKTPAQRDIRAMIREAREAIALIPSQHARVAKSLRLAEIEGRLNLKAQRK
jgi:hypothetical protein